MNHRLAGIVARLIATVSLALMFAFVKLAGERGVHVIESLFYRQGLALPLLACWIVVSGGGWAAIRTRRPLAHIGRTAIGLSGMALNFVTVLLLPLAEATVIGFMVPIFATVLATLLLGEITGRYRWAAVLAGFAGVVLAVRPGSGVFPPAGIAIGVIGAVVTAGVSITLRQIGRTEKAITTVAWFTLLSMPPLSLLMFRYGSGHDPGTWLLLLGIGLTGGIAQLALTASLRLAPVSVVLPIDYLTLVWALALGWLLFGTIPAGSTWTGIPLIIGAGLVIIHRERRRRSERQALAGPAD